jgi:iron complex transport system ATP-binding protein
MSHGTGRGVALELSNVSYRVRGAGTLVEKLSLHVHDGEILVIAGPNGAGKSTLIRMIAGLSAPSGGEILLGGRAYSRIGITERARSIAYVGQSDDTDARLTVAQYVALGNLPHRGANGARAAIDATCSALALAGLDALRERRMGDISGGERQRAKIARAVCQKPTILVLDEPTNHLDPSARGELLSLVSGLGITVIAALHDLTLIEAFASHVALIRAGALVAYGHPADVLTSAQVRDVFSVDMHRLPHPSEPRHISVLDIPVEGRFPVMADSGVHMPAHSTVRRPVLVSGG